MGAGIEEGAEAAAAAADDESGVAGCAVDADGSDEPLVGGSDAVVLAAIGAAAGTVAAFMAELAAAALSCPPS